MSQSLLDCHTGSTACDSGWMNGCMSEVLRSFFSYQVAVGQHDVRVQARRAHAEVERDQKIELAFRALVVRDDFLGSRDRLVALHAVRRAEEMLEEVLVALARGAEQVRAPDEQVAREVVGWSGSSQLIFFAALQLLGDVVLGVRSRASPASSAIPRGFLWSCGAEGSQPMRSARTLKSIRLHRTRLVGERREDLGHRELLVAPLVGVRVEERGRVHLPRRPRPVEREGERGPAGLRAQLLLSDVVRPAAARLVRRSRTSPAG